MTHPSHHYAVIFCSWRSDANDGYGPTADRMIELAREQSGFLGVRSARNPDGFGITVSYWTDEAAIRAWKRNAEHRIAQERGRRQWYADYEICVARVERSYRMDGSPG